MREDYRRMQEELLPAKETQEWIWESIEKKAKEGGKKRGWSKRFRLAAGIAAAALALAVCLPQTGLANGVIVFLEKYFEVKADLEQDTVQNVFEDQDEHIKMQVQNMLSDGAIVYMDICYEALDKEGERWLSQQVFDWAESIQFVYDLEKYKESTVWGGRLCEQKELATEKKRYFTYYFEDSSGNYNLKNDVLTLTYPMYQGQGSQEITLACNLETLAYQLKGEGSPSKFYSPKLLLASKLSFSILGDDQGMTIRDVGGFGPRERMNEEFIAELDARRDAGKEELPISLIMKDGSRMKISDLAITKYPSVTGMDGVDVSIAAGGYQMAGEQDWSKYCTIDPKELAGLELGGISYDLVPIENPR